MNRGKRTKANIFDWIVCTTIFVCSVLIAIISLIILSYAVYAPSNIFDRINEDTGFFVSADKVTFNITTGTATAHRVKITNPQEYPELDFLNIKKVVVKLNPIKFLMSKFEISSFEMDIESMHCIRTSASKNNLNDFLNLIHKSFSFAETNEIFKINIGKCFFADFSDNENPFYKNIDTPILIEKKGDFNTKDLSQNISSSFRKADAEFLITAVTSLRN